MPDQKFSKVEVAKVDDELGVVFGWAIISKVEGEEYFDSQGDHIPEDAMLTAATEFMQNSRVAKEMHTGDKVGDVVFAFPLTTELAKAMDIETRYTGLMLAMKPSDPGVLEKFRSGEYRGFSIGGLRGRDEEVEKGFSPSQPRAQDGKWTSGGGSGGNGSIAGGGETGFGEGKVTLHTAFSLRGRTPFTRIPDEKSYAANIVAAGYDSINQFEELTGTNFAEAKGRWMAITNDRVTYYEGSLGKNPPQGWDRTTEVVDLKTRRVV